MSSKYLKNLLDHIEASCKVYQNFTPIINGKVSCNHCNKEIVGGKSWALFQHLKHCKNKQKKGEASVEGGDNEDIDSEATE
uniref:BED-type domain-containing protein n=1 Tax=Meloidogyne enterolobii TaxID=390850 RepID=A0A6V7V7N3_MELEN|nr:unnamed protein product [Meloidogyne enterolobii]